MNFRRFSFPAFCGGVADDTLKSDDDDIAEIK